MPAPLFALLRRRRGRGRARCWRALLGASVAVTLAGQTRADAATPPFAIDIDDQQAIFQLTNLKPGPVGSRCLLVSVRNGVADEAVLSATVGGTGLADYLDLTVEVGTSADPAVCTDFVGTAAFTGTVAQLGTLHADPATGVPLPLAARTSAVVRFTLALQSVNAAQGRTATLVLRFDAQDASGPPPTTTLPPTTAPPPATTLPPTTLPPTTLPPTTPPSTTPVTSTPPGPPTGTSPPAPGVPAGPSAPTTGAATTTTVEPTTTTGATTTLAGPNTTRPSGGFTGARTTVAAPAATAPSPAPEAGGGDVEVVITDPTVEPEPVTVVARAVEVVTETATTAAKTTSVPAGFLSFVFAFLVVQDRFDRNDPKLARAPLAPEPEMVFQPRRGRLGP